MRKVVVEQVELFAERAWLVARAERGAEKIGEILDRLLGLGRAACGSGWRSCSCC